jgi:hypothetical protein
LGTCILFLLRFQPPIGGGCDQKKMSANRRLVPLRAWVMRIALNMRLIIRIILGVPMSGNAAFNFNTPSRFAHLEFSTAARIAGSGIKRWPGAVRL